MVEIEKKFTEKTIKNDFTPNCENDYLSIVNIFQGLKIGAFSKSNLPHKAQKLLDEYLDISINDQHKKDKIKMSAYF
jgi:hypothetical protein